MKTIWRFELDFNLELLTPLYTTSRMPNGAEIKHVARLECGVCAWALVSSETLPGRRRFAAYATGDTVPRVAVYLGTIFNESNVALHIHEVAANQGD